MLTVIKNMWEKIRKDNLIVSIVKNYRLLFLTGLLIIIEKTVISSLVEGITGVSKFVVDYLLTLLIVIPPLYMAIKGEASRAADQEKAMFMALHDSLTGLPNRVKLKEKLKELVRYNKKSTIGIMFLDLDSFKAVNDTLGHDIGDKLLQAVAKRLKNCIKEKDIICRLGGDEFVLVFPDLAEVETIEVIAKKIIGVFRNSFNIDGHILNVTASIGISLCPSHGKEVEKLIKNADMAMYKSKLSGKNRYEFYTEELEGTHTEIAGDIDNSINA
jgi:diguanylate cyclase (GGDEF)-like protein